MMINNQFEVADVFRKFLGPYRRQFGSVMMPSQQRAANDIIACMTETMGGSCYQCNACDKTFWTYHGCSNRSCPKCHGRQTEKWMAKRNAEMLACDYFHVVATVPNDLHTHFLKNQKDLYSILMKAVSAALCELAKEKRFIGAVPGILAVLHTWTSKMHFHPHVHMLVTGGGMNKDGDTWHEAQSEFLVPVKKLSPLIKKLFAEALRKKRPKLFSQISKKVWKKEWCSFCKPFGEGSEAVTRYLARYVFRIAITSNRIVNIDEKHVTFKYKENSTGTWKTEKISGIDFIRRFLLHVLPKGFHKVRYYGLWSPTKRNLQRRALIFLAFSQKNSDNSEPKQISSLASEVLTKSEIELQAPQVKCPKCNSENVRLINTKKRGEMPMLT